MEFMTIIIDNLLRFFIRLLRKVLNISINIERRLIKDRDNTTFHRNQIIRSTQRYNMVTSLDEPYYQEQYWHWIKKYLDFSKLPVSGRYLDLGCGQGRLSIPLAKWCANKGKVIGVDFSKIAIEQARQYASESGLSNIDYYTVDILSFLKEKNPNSFDGILLLEVTYVLPEYCSVLKEIKRILKPGGLLFVSFRSQYFDVLYSVAKHNWDDIDTILKNRIGRLGNGDIYFTWQTSNEMAHLIEKKLKFEILDLCGIGCCSGIEGDPHGFITRPSGLNKNERKTLMKLEIALADSVPDAGRYILCIARKKY